MRRSMVDIQSATAEIKQGKKEEERPFRTSGTGTDVLPVTQRTVKGRLILLHANVLCT